MKKANQKEKKQTWKNFKNNSFEVHKEHFYQIRNLEGESTSPKCHPQNVGPHP